MHHAWTQNLLHVDVKLAMCGISPWVTRVQSMYSTYIWYSRVCPKKILAYPTDKYYGIIYLFTLPVVVDF